MMKAIKSIFLLSLSFFPWVASAQQIKGKLIDKFGTGISRAALIFQQPQDSLFLSGTTTNDAGEFEVTLHTLPYRLIIQHIAFDTKIITGSESDLGDLVLNEKPEQLGEVMVKASRPLMKIDDNGAFSYNAKEMAKNRPTRNALDLLEEVPAVQKRGEQYEIIGASSTTIILNGRRSNLDAGQLQQYLATLPPEQIKSIDVFYNTPPQYGVKGASINVVLEKQRSDKLQVKGNVYATLTQKFYASETGGFQLSVAKKRGSWEVGYSIGNTRSHSDYTLNSLHSIEEDTYHLVLNTVQRHDNRSHHFTSLFSYDFKNKDALRVSYTGQLADTQNGTRSNMDILDERQTDSRNDIDGNNGLHSVSAEYVHKSWTIGADYLHYNQDTEQDLVSESDADADADTLISESVQKVNKWGFYIHNTSKIGKGQLAYGVDASFSNTDNDHDVVSTGETYPDDRSFQTEQKEKSFSVFIGYNQRLGKKGLFNVALKGEYFKADVKTETETGTLWNDFHLFPSLTFAYRIRPERMLQIALSSQKNYPAYWKTTANKNYMNAYCLTEGNPSLKPYETYQLNVNYIIRNKYIIGLFGDVSPDYSTQLMYQNPDRLLATYKYVNFDYSGKAGLMGIVPIRWCSVFSTRLTLTGFVMKQKGSLEGISFNRSKVSGRINMVNDFVLNRARTLSFQLAGWYQLPAIQGFYDVKNMYNTSAALSWLSPKGNWNLTLKGEDLFDFYRMKTKVDGYTQHYAFNNRTDSRSISLNIRYVFKGYKEKKAPEIDASRLGI